MIIVRDLSTLVHYCDIISEICHRQYPLINAYIYIDIDIVTVIDIYIIMSINIKTNNNVMGRILIQVNLLSE